MKKNMGKVIIILLVFVIAAGAVFAYKEFNNKKDEENGIFNEIEQDPNVVVDMDAESYDEMMKKMQQKVDEGMVNVKFQNQIIVASNSKEGKIEIANPDSNHYDTFVTIFLDETQEKICQTGVIPLGGKVEKVTLDKVLPDGSHNATLVYNMIDENKKVVEQVNLGVVIQVGN